MPARERAPATAWTRRSFLAAGASWSVVLLGAWATSTGCSRSDGGAALAAAIRTHHGELEAAGPLARASGWDLDRALGVLARSAPAALDDESVRLHLERQMRQDFVDDHVQLVDRRWLSDTEVALAVVLSEKPR
jgi:hypothetical protein